jgi:hypothetical protein
MHANVNPFRANFQLVAGPESFDALGGVAMEPYSFPTVATDFALVKARAIDAADDTFRVRRRYPTSLGESVRRGGIRTPLLIEREGERYRLVSGWGRWEMSDESASLPCFVLPGDLPREAVWDIFLRDNDRWNVVEIGRVLRGLKDLPGLDFERIVTEKLPLLGVRSSQDLYRRHLRLLELSPEAQLFIEEENLPLRRASVFFKLPADALGLLLSSARELRFTFNQLGEVLEMLDEVSHRDGVPAREILQELRSAPEKERFRRELRERRYPELSRYRERLGKLEKEMAFTVPVRIEWDAQLERPGVRLLVDLTERENVDTFERELAVNRRVLARFFEIL